MRCAELIAANLSPRERQALVLKHEGLTRAETAQQLGCGKKHVKNLWQSGRRKARRVLPAQKVAEFDSCAAATTVLRIGSLSDVRQV